MNVVEPLSASRMRAELRAALGENVRIARVPTGFAIGSTGVLDDAGDPIDMYLVPSADGMRLEDDGEFLGNLAAGGVDLIHGPMAERVAAVLDDHRLKWNAQTGAFWTDPFPASELSSMARLFAEAQRRLRALA